MAKHGCVFRFCHYDTTIAAKLLRQLESFPGRISPHFRKPVARFIGDMIYGIMAWIGNSEKHDVIADGASDVLKRGRRWRGFDPEEAERREEASLFAFFGMNTG
ncbi:MAG: hypothetical protein ACI4Q3_03140 [Kiritimatiellia bacterium]